MNSYTCANTTCKINKSKASFPTLINCPVCEQELVSSRTIDFNSNEKNIIDNYPYVIAHTFYKMHTDGTTAHSKAYFLKDVVNGTLKHLALLVATEYFESSIKNEAINRLFNNNLRHHTLGQLHEFIRESLKELKKENHDFFLMDLPIFYNKVQTSRKKTYKISTAVTNEIGDLVYNTEKLTAIDALINFRNREIGHGLTWTQEKYKELFENYYPILLDLLEAMVFVADYPMFKWEKGYIWNLMGSKISKIGRQSIPDNKSDQIWIENTHNQKLNLLPFFILPKSYITGSPGYVELFIYEDFTGNKIIYLSPENERGITSGKIVEVLSSKIDSKKIKNLYTSENLTKEIFINKVLDFNKKIWSGLVKEGKVKKNIYQSRSEDEANLLSWVDTKFGLFFIYADAGSGKTNLLVEMQKQYNHKDINSLLIRANRVSNASITDSLQDILDLQQGFDFTILKDLGFSRGNPFIILIDGGNEHNTPVSFLTEILNFLKKYSGGFIKVVLSWRAELSNELPPIDGSFSDLIYSDKTLNRETNHLAQKGFYLKVFNNQELEQAWDKYAKGPNRKYKLQFKLEDLAYYDRSLLRILHNPFNLNIFLSLFNNKKPLPKKGKRYNIWENYWKKIGKDKDQYELLNCLVHVMFNQRINNAPAAILYEDRVFKEYLYDNDIKGPYEQLKLKGVIVEYYLNNERYISFAFEGVYHYALSKYLAGNDHFSAPENLYRLLEENLMPGIPEAVKHLLYEDVNQDQFSRLFFFINEVKSFYEVSIPPLTLAISLAMEKEKSEPSNFDKVDLLWRNISSPNASEDSLIIIEKILYHCQQLQRFDLVEFIYQKLNFQEKVLSNTQLELTINSISYLEKNDKYKTIEFLKNYENQIGFGNDFNLLNNFGNVLFVIGEYATSLEYLEKALKKHKLYSITYFSSLNDKGLDLLNLERLQEAADLFESALEIITTNPEIEYNEDIHMSLYQNFALSLKKLNKNKRAIPIYFKVLNLIIEKYGSQHSITAQVFNNIATNFRALEEYDRALEHHQKALKIRLNLFGENNPETAKSYHNMAYLFQVMGQIEKAIDYYSKAFLINQSNYQPNHPMIYAYYKMVGDLWMKLGEVNNAIIPLKKTWEISNTLYGSKHNLTYNCLEDFVEAALKLKEPNYKIENLEYWWEYTTEKKGGVAYELFTIYRKLENNQKALKWLEQAYITRKERLGKEDELTVQTFQELTSFAKKTKQLQMIEKLY